MSKHLAQKEWMKLQDKGYPNWEKTNNLISCVTCKWRTPINPSTSFITRLEVKCNGLFFNVDYTQNGELYTKFCFQFREDAEEFIEFYKDKIIIVDNTLTNALIVWLAHEK